MSHNNPRWDHPSSYFVQETFSEEELTRLAIQDRIVTASMGGVLPEQPDPRVFHRVLDVACGTGRWLIDAAKTYPEMSFLAGVDISSQRIGYARVQAEKHYVNDRVTFRVMNALQALAFEDNYFDLVNLRFGISFIHIWDWSDLITEMLRVLRPGGIIRLTDEEIIHESNSPASMQFCAMLMHAFFKAHHIFSPESVGVTAHLAPQLSLHGCQQVQAKPYALEYRAGTPEGNVYIEDGKHILHILIPFLQRHGYTHDEYEPVCQQALQEIQRPDFCATWKLLTAWGIKGE